MGQIRQSLILQNLHYGLQKYNKPRPIKINKIILMSNTNCTQQNCVQNCCNYFGSCPDSQSASTLYSQCYYHYAKSNELSNGAIVGIALGSLFGFFILTYLILCICRKARGQNSGDGLQHSNNINTTQNQIIANNHWNNSMPSQGQPYLVQQAYVQPIPQAYAQPYGYAQPYPYPQPQPYREPYQQVYVQPQADQNCLKVVQQQVIPQIAFSHNPNQIYPQPN